MCEHDEDEDDDITAAAATTTTTTNTLPTFGDPLHLAQVQPVHRWTSTSAALWAHGNPWKVLEATLGACPPPSVDR